MFTNQEITEYFAGAIAKLKNIKGYSTNGVINHLTEEEVSSLRSGDRVLVVDYSLCGEIGICSDANNGVRVDSERQGYRQYDKFGSGVIYPGRMDHGAGLYHPILRSHDNEVTNSLNFDYNE